MLGKMGEIDVDIFTLALWVVAAIGLVISIRKNKRKTIRSMKFAKGMMKNIAGEIVGILLLIGLILTFIPPEMIKEYMGQSNQVMATALGALVGRVTLIPAFVAFPLVASFVDMGMSIVPAVAFLTTLTMVGLVTFPLEKQQFGTKFTLVRNTFSLIFAVLIALVMGVLI